MRPLAPLAFNEELKETLLCFVLVDLVTSAHAFCSRYDFGPWPLLPGVDRLPDDVCQVMSCWLASQEAIVAHKISIFCHFQLMGSSDACKHRHVVHLHQALAVYLFAKCLVPFG